MKTVALLSFFVLMMVMPAIADVTGKHAEDNIIFLQLMSTSGWNDLSETQRELYVEGFLETLSFFAYGSSARDAKAAQSFSDWTACAEHEPPKRWTIMVDWLFGKLETSGAWQCFKASEVICKPYEGKGDRSWKLLQLVSSAGWNKFSAQDKQIYAIAYAETGDLMLRRTKQDSNANKLENCMKNGGDQRFFTAAKNISVETQYPMPWSVASALGNACH
jgi:hypothetical protein